MVTEMEKEERLGRRNENDRLRRAQETDEDRQARFTCSMHKYPKCGSS